MIFKIPKISKSTIFVIIPILYFNSCTFEFAKQYSFVLPVVLACVLIWFVFLLKEEVNVQIHSILPMVVYTLILGSFILVGGQNRITVLMSDLKNTIYMIFFMLIFIVYSEKKYKNDRAWILFFCVTDIVISGIYSIYRLIEEPNLSRLLSTGSFHRAQEAAQTKGIVSFGVVYGLVLILLVLFYLILQKKKSRLLYIVLFSLFTTVLFFAQFFLAICLLGLGVVLILSWNYFKRGKNGIRFFIFTVIAIFCIVLLPFLLRIIIENDIFGNEINIRLQEILNFFNGENMEGTDFSARIIQYFMSLSAFVLSYGMGKIVVGSVDVGYHSQWFDGFGNYGLFFILYIIAVVVFRNFIVSKLYSIKAKQLYGLVFCIYCIMSLTNTSTWAPITLSLFVTVPFLCIDKVNE